MAHSNKPQPLADACDGPYFQECRAAAELSSEQQYWDEVLYQEGARHDQFDGWGEDLTNDGLGENEEADAADAVAGLIAPAPPRQVVAPAPLSDDDILF